LADTLNKVIIIIIIIVIVVVVVVIVIVIVIVFVIIIIIIISIIVIMVKSNDTMIQSPIFHHYTVLLSPVMKVFNIQLRSVYHGLLASFA